MKEQRILILIQAALGALGICILLSISWKMALGVFLCLWANNIYMGYVWKKQ